MVLDGDGGSGIWRRLVWWEELVMEDDVVALLCAVDGWLEGAVVRRHAGLAAAAAGDGRRSGEGERWRCQTRWGSAASRDFDPSSDLPLCNFGPSPFLLSSQEGPFLL